MEQEKSSARRDRISIAEKAIDESLQYKQPESNQDLAKKLYKLREIKGEISPLKWKSPTNGIAGLL
ncbi:hypothetical protein [Pedobacter sp. Leaf176]|uniref:hypothetical protein n=1 Tax=Pedobacter sp. Leaf176 TaxID=1736286 RepID=UPI0006FC9ED7|nr:hypothetical protein [Pedobacter sp. Leaf176]KQR70406.1 hypothetical protein ASF92_10515 [Pedobacter sp. Leaf176]